MSLLSVICHCVKALLTLMVHKMKRNGLNDKNINSSTATKTQKNSLWTLVWNRNNLNGHCSVHCKDSFCCYIRDSSNEIHNSIVGSLGTHSKITKDLVSGSRAGRLFVHVAVFTDHNELNVCKKLCCMTQLHFLKLWICLCLWHSTLQKLVH